MTDPRTSQFDPNFPAQAIKLLVAGQDLNLSQLQYAVRAAIENVVDAGENTEGLDALRLATFILGGAAPKFVFRELVTQMMASDPDTATQMLHWMLQQLLPNPGIVAPTQPPAPQPSAPPAPPKFARPDLPGENADTGAPEDDASAAPESGDAERPGRRRWFQSDRNRSASDGGDTHWNSPR